MDPDTPPLPPELRPPDADATQDYERIWAALHRTDDAQASTYNVDAAWGDLADRLDLDDASQPAEAPAVDRPARPSDHDTDSRLLRPARTLAAAVLVLCAVAVGAWWWQQPVSVTTAAGEQTTVVLPDGSTVELNGGTTLAYDRGFQSLPFVPAAQRRVQLTGEAFFEVDDGDRPFHVTTPNARVEVLGTTFDVRTRTGEDAPETTVTLTSGRVRLRPTAAPASAPDSGVVLSETGHASRVVADRVPTAPEAVDLKYVQAWRNGGFGIQNASLPTVLEELERRFGVLLFLRVPSADTAPMTLHYAADAELEDVLRDICVIQGLSYRKTSRGYELVRD
ncbi:transmembrane sensor [Salinibacter ruber]|jgi:transmembrane sensor|uniref:FecR family protein n=1 Tax=Salinibacter ruber TaxID=146919 RepID=UPI000E56967F|nr:FecR family protein [Salinibacter ruber]MCS3632135.1 transmembrane sensor [Salinibacter ruber]